MRPKIVSLNAQVSHATKAVVAATRARAALVSRLSPLPLSQRGERKQRSSATMQCRARRETHMGSGREDAFAWGILSSPRSHSCSLVHKFISNVTNRPYDQLKTINRGDFGHHIGCQEGRVLGKMASKVPLGTLKNVRR